jgi:hypothetical protein
VVVLDKTLDKDEQLIKFYNHKIMRKLFNHIRFDLLAFYDNICRMYRLARYFEGLKDAVHLHDNCGSHQGQESFKNSSKMDNHSH